MHRHGTSRTVRRNVQIPVLTIVYISCWYCNVSTYSTIPSLNYSNAFRISHVITCVWWINSANSHAGNSDLIEQSSQGAELRVFKKNRPYIQLCVSMLIVVCDKNLKFRARFNAKSANIALLSSSQSVAVISASITSVTRNTSYWTTIISPASICCHLWWRGVGVT